MMTIVQFRNGKYGVRKWSWYHCCYVFMTRNSGEMVPKDPACAQEFTSIAEASCECDRCLSNDAIEDDMGKPVRDSCPLIEK